MTLIAAIVAAFGLPTAASAATITQTTPFQDTVLACNGVDPIAVSGQLFIVSTVTFDAAGGALFADHFQPLGVTGTNLQTGTKYLGTGLTRDLTVFAPNGTTTFTFVNLFHLQAMAGSDSLDVRETVHVTALPNGITVFVDHFSTNC